MNNSLHRLIDGMITTLRAEVIPQIGTEFARGQAYGVIYMLNSIRLRAEWSSGFYREQLATQTELRDALLPLVSASEAEALPQVITTETDGPALEQLRDANEARICDLIDWLAAPDESFSPGLRDTVDAALRRYMDRALKHELSTSAKPMFAEMSAGAE